ncbi:MULTISPECIES: ricin-type beta-trefoil lectin domain protein [unclassified Streptomyces]|uniref:ricin-type beta-trefoil lectin domain protein n=1 Tax=unclassified Streptomyces TaxID=2593676 RepID=UPI0037FC81E0
MASVKSMMTSIQVFSDDTNLDAYDGKTLWTRSPEQTYQVWQLELVGETPAGTGIYTIESTHYKGQCLEATTRGGPVTMKPRTPDKLSQRWVVDTGEEQTTIESVKFRALVLTANGEDTPVILKESTPDAPNQAWTLFTKM